MPGIDKIILSFDLDFTLIDNREGIINSFTYALQKFGLPVIHKAIIEKMIGTPLEEMFSSVSDFEPSLLCSAFRDYYGSKGIFQVNLYPGVKYLLKTFKRFFKLGVITSKKEELAIELLQNLKIADYFDFILGETEGRKSKTHPDLIQFLLETYRGYKFVIIGDHPNDKKLAAKLECPFIGVLTGNHSAKGLESTNTQVKMIILNSIEELTKEKILSLF